MNINIDITNMHFNVGVAKCVGVEGAVMLNNIQYWIIKNKANEKHFYDGKYWTYNTLDAFTKLFPFWSKRQIERILNNLKKDGYIEDGNYNKIGYDRTKWYTLTEKGWLLISRNGDISNFNISPNGDIENTKKGNGNHDLVTPIPNQKPNQKPNNNIPSSQMDEIWRLYPNKKGKADAYKKMPLLISKYGFEEIKKCVERYALEVKGKDKKFMAYGSTFFSGRFEDYLDENYEPSNNEKGQEDPFAGMTFI